MNTNADRAWREFLDVLTGGRSPDQLSEPPWCGWCGGTCHCEEGEDDNEFYDREDWCENDAEDDIEYDDAENWRDGTMRDGMRRARRMRP